MRQSEGWKSECKINAEEAATHSLVMVRKAEKAKSRLESGQPITIESAGKAD